MRVVLGSSEPDDSDSDDSARLSRRWGLPRLGSSAKRLSCACGERAVGGEAAMKLESVSLIST